MEAVIIMLLFIISIELVLILQRLGDKEEEKTNPRREIRGTFKDPLGDQYRKNSKGLYKPIKPNRGDEEDDDL